MKGSRPHILVLSQYFWPETFRITELVRTMRAHGAEISVLTAQPNYPDGMIAPGYRALSLRTETHEGVTIHRVPLLLRGRAGAIRLAANYLSFVVSAACLGPWMLRGKRVDVILVYAPSPILQAIPAVWIAWLKGARLVTWVQDLWPESLRTTGFVKNSVVLRAVGLVVRWIYRRNDLLLVQSPAFVEPVRAMGGVRDVEYFPNPGERDESSSTAATPALALKPGFNVVFAGNLGTAQALETLLAAAARLRDLPDVRIVLVGSGSRVEWVRGEVARLGLPNVELPGRFPPAAMSAIFAQAGALLVSLSKSPILSQTVPSKIPTYLAAGRPIIASLDGAGARIVDESGAGVTCAAEDAEGLAEAIRGLHRRSDDERRIMGERARAYHKEHFDMDVLADRLEMTLARVVGETNASAGHATAPRDRHVG